ncbi:hypothetical protein G6F57_018120 [Rhizopus arrhizus]|nr:hypothetical protein G6F23_014610 [Rhizopus arrhizus]KAG1443367.1 hypothetical protein G6F57_018120 [Rhizopus arrhizus]
MLGRPRQFGDEGLQVLVVAPGAALAAVGRKPGGIHAHGHTGLAVVAMGAVGEQPATAKALLDQLRVRARVDQMAGRGDLRPSLSTRQVAARVGSGCVELQRGEGKFFELAHGE